MNTKTICNLFFIVLLITCIFPSCDTGTTSERTDEDDCKFGSPVAILDFENGLLSQHSFTSINKNTSIEEVLIADTLKLSLEQSGCNDIKQVFQFLHKKKIPNDPKIIAIQLSKNMLLLGNLDLKTVKFGEWANIIDQVSSEVKLGKLLEIQTDFFLSIDKVNINGNPNVLQLILIGK